MGIDHSKFSSDEAQEFHDDSNLPLNVDPFDVDDRFQEKLLANLIHDEEFLDRIGDVIRPAYFNKEEYQFICKSIVENYRDYLKPVTDTTLLLGVKEQFTDPTADALKKKILLLVMKLFDYTEIGNLLKDSERVQGFSTTFIKQQEMKLAIIKSAEMIPRGDFKMIFSTIEGAFSVGISKNIGTDLDDHEDREKTKPRVDVRSTPWEAINKRIKGGLGKGEFMAIIAPMGAGKTMLAANMMAHCKRTRTNAVLYSLEMLEAYNRHRIDALLLGENLGDLNMDDPLTRDRIKDKLELYPPSKSIIKHFDGQETTMQTLKTHIKQLKARGIHPDWIVIDYLDILDPLDSMEKRKKDWEKFEVISREVSMFAKQEKVAVVGLLQTNTQGIDLEVITAKSTSGGAKRLHPADIILGYARPDHFKVMEKATLSFIKNRFGKDGYSLEVATNYDRGVISVKDSEYVVDDEARKASESNIKKSASQFVNKIMSKNQTLGNSYDPDDPFTSSI